METTASFTHALPCPIRGTGIPPCRMDGTGPCAGLIEFAFQPAGLSDEVASALAAQAKARRFGPGEVVFSRGAPATALWLVARGRVALGTMGANGLLQVRRTVQPAGWLELAGALQNGCHAEDAVAETACQLWELPTAALMQSLREKPEAGASLISLLAAQVQELIEGSRDMSMKDVRSRCASWLLEQARSPEDGPEGDREVELQQRKRAIALQLGTTAETFSRTLHQLSRDGMIVVDGYRIRLLDTEGLRKLAQPHAKPGRCIPARCS